MKKIYLTPLVKAIVLRPQTIFLAGSGEGDDLQYDPNEESNEEGEF